MYEKFTDRARKVMLLANQEAQKKNHEYVGTEHVLLGLLREGSGVASTVLRSLKVDYCILELEIDKLVQEGPEMAMMGKLPHTPRTKKVLEYAMEEATKLGHNYVGTEHLLLGLMDEHEGVAYHVLKNLGLKPETVRSEIVNLLGCENTQECIEKIKKECEANSFIGVIPMSDTFKRIKPLLQQIVDIMTENGI